MATRKCGNIYFPKYFMAVRPFFTRIFFRNYLGWRGKNISLKISSGAQSENLRKIFLVLYAAYVYPFWVVNL